MSDLSEPRPRAPRDAPPSARHRLLRIATLLLSLLVVVLSTSALGLVASARAADEASGPKRAVIVAGPVHSATARYRGYAEAIADAAAAQGMEVTRIFHPNATAERVKRFANGADLFVYAGHGNGWPSPYPPFQERTKNGLGLNPSDPDKRTASNVVYKGADWLRANITFAPNAVVILSHLSYASGNASSGMAIPSRSVAIERIDNFANGFLACGARVVWALGWQPGADIVRALARDDATMDAVFRTRFRSGVNPLNGWIGASPGIYDSVRTPGAKIHIDPDPTYGYLRGLTGDLSFTTTAWRDEAAAPEDTEAPVLSDVSASQAKVTIAGGEDTPPVFTPNGDGISDTIAIAHRLSENAFIDVTIAKDGKVARQLSVWALRGRGTITWNGRRDDGDYVGEGRFTVTLTPSDRAGNVGEEARVRVLALSSMRAPAVSPRLFHASDGDALAASTVLRAKLTRPATVSWLIRDGSGNVVRTGMDAVEVEPGMVRFRWDGTDDAGVQLPDGRYTGRIRVTRPMGTYAHDVRLRKMAFVFDPDRWSPRRGQTVIMVFEAAEPIKGRPVITAKQPGKPTATLRVKRLDATTFRTSYQTKRGGRAGQLVIRLTATDAEGGAESAVFRLRLR